MEDNIIKTFEELVVADFSKDRINLDEMYKIVCEHEEKNKEDEVPQGEEDAEQIIKKAGKKLLGKKTVDEIFARYESIVSFLSKFDVNTPLVKGMGTENRNKLFAISKNMTGEFVDLFNKLKFTLTFNSKEFEFMRDMFSRDIKYDIKEIFTLKEIDKTHISKWLTMEVKDTMKIKFSSFAIQAFNYFLQTQKVSAFGEKRELYLNVAQKFSDAINIINASTAVTDRVKSYTSMWLDALNEDLKEKIK